MPSASTVFVDTNVLLYALDPRSAVKRGVAETWLRHLWQAEAGRISTQVLNELYANLRRVAPSLNVQVGRDMVRHYRVWRPWAVDEGTVDLAWKLQDRFSLSYWDGLVLASAQLQGCSWLLSEDLQHEQQIDGVRVINPFLVGLERLNLAP